MKTKKVTATALPPETEIQKWVAQLGGIAQLVGTQGAVLTPQARRQMAKALKGGKDLLPSLQRMAARHGVQVSGLAPADLQPHLDLVTTLEPLGAALQSAATLVGDTTLQAKSLTWKGTTALYTILSRMARTNPTLRDELQPATAFFAAAKKGSKAAKGTSGTKMSAAATPPASSDVAVEAAPEAAPSVANGAAKPEATAAVPSSTPTQG